jgi:hypothetical protein
VHCNTCDLRWGYGYLSGGLGGRWGERRGLHTSYACSRSPVFMYNSRLEPREHYCTMSTAAFTINPPPTLLFSHGQVRQSAYSHLPDSTEARIDYVTENKIRIVRHTPEHLLAFPTRLLRSGSNCIPVGTAIGHVSRLHAAEFTLVTRITAPAYRPTCNTCCIQMLKRLCDCDYGTCPFYRA